MNGNEQKQVNNTLLYRDSFISMFFDDEKYLAIFVNDRGLTKVISVDDNFYSIEEDIIAYRDLIAHSLATEEEQKEYLRAFASYCEQSLYDMGQELNYEYLNSKGVLL